MKYRPFEQYFQQNPTKFSTGIEPNLKERISKKEIDIFCRELLENNSELKEKILRQMENLKEKNLPMPITHITSAAVKSGGGMISTGFVENIKTHGLRKRDTNVGVFVVRDKETTIAKPEFYIRKPEEFIKSLRLFLQRYLHHGVRTNKQALGELRGEGGATPVMVVIEGGVELGHGSDYDDHYILKEGAAREQIIGTINLDSGVSSGSQDDVARVAESLLDLLSSYLGGQKEGVDKKLIT